MINQETVRRAARRARPSAGLGLTLLVGAVLGAGLGGCSPSPPVNRDPSIGERVWLEAIQPEKVTPPLPPLAPGEADKPSLAAGSLDRSHWKVRAVVMPVDGTSHRPTYATGPAYTHSTARQRGEFPTIETALELGDRESRWSEVFEGLAWPFWAGADVALAPARMIAQPPWELTESPAGPRARAPIGTASPGRLGSPEAPAVGGLNATPTVPVIEEPRWIWRNGMWYLWVPGEPEPWLTPSTPTPPASGGAPVEGGEAGGPTGPGTPSGPGAGSGPGPRPAPARSDWIFQDGRWVKRSAKPSSAPEKQP